MRTSTNDPFLYCCAALSDTAQFRCAILPTMTTPDNTAHVRGNIRAEAARKGLSQRELADKLGISATAMHMRLRGSTRLSADDLYRIAEALDVDVAVLLAETQAAS